MSKDLNQCNFIGRLVGRPDLKSMPNGEPVCNIAIAVSDDYKDKNGIDQEVTEWVKVVAYGKFAEIIKSSCKKGGKVFISGKMRTRYWKQDGERISCTEIVAHEIHILDGNSQSHSNHHQDMD